MGTTPRLRERWPLWVIDGFLLGLFMFAVAVFVGLIESPASSLHALLPSPLVRRGLVGAGMGLTAIALIYSPLGERSGAHMNPAVTLGFLRLGRIRPLDACGYVVCQFAGGVAGATIGGVVAGPLFTDEPVRYAPTVPGVWGVPAAFAAEVAMTFILMSTVLYASNTRRLARWTGVFAGVLLFTFITVESPVSGMSLNPARTLASAVPAGVHDALWMYFAAPTLGVLAAAEVFRNLRVLPRVHCCKLNHCGPGVCPHCGCDGPIHFEAHTDDPR
ncbi:MAG: aquaporin family protein [Leptolyngbya sp. PLA2]|nr:aquaporin family protein [Leptolyngbya sp.]MCE7970900.1 aquaporin family protein [Leptolyngbya sp. PL-A2]MCQ3940285.1 aquaporin family protein [cyanobacterium CYA1]MCZ7633741.1 aquaporin [Phycisphaerales bacterium]MDL1904645.1 aquaporin family protein [Synechococcales cyanobacterium CNB]GIK20398.1 MAG: hypothetical protein BroJett004_25620 [Planctomycetota bacterium]